MKTRELVTFPRVCFALRPTLCSLLERWCDIDSINWFVEDHVEDTQTNLRCRVLYYLRPLSSLSFSCKNHDVTATSPHTLSPVARKKFSPGRTATLDTVQISYDDRSDFNFAPPVSPAQSLHVHVVDSALGVGDVFATISRKLARYR